MQIELTVQVKILVRYNKNPSAKELSEVLDAAKNRLGQAALNGAEGPIGQDWTPVGTDGNSYRLKGADVFAGKVLDD